MTDPATTMLPSQDDPGSGWFEPPLEATTKLAVVDRRPSPVPRAEPDPEPAAVRPYVAEVADPVYPADPEPSPRVELAPLQVHIAGIDQAVVDAIAHAVALALRTALYTRSPRHAAEPDPAPLYDETAAAVRAGLLCSTLGCCQTAGHAPPCDQQVAGDDDQEAAAWR